MKKKKKNFEIKASSAELNVMPFIDIFSLLCTFLLFSSVFISLGIHTVQVPFFSNANNLNSKAGESKREISLFLEVSKKNIKLISKWTKEPINKKIFSYRNTEGGLDELHETLLKLKKQSTSSDKIEVFIDDDVSYESMTLVLDEVILFDKEDKKSKNFPGTSELFPKVILSNIIF